MHHWLPETPHFQVGPDWAALLLLLVCAEEEARHFVSGVLKLVACEDFRRVVNKRLAAPRVGTCAAAGLSRTACVLCTEWWVLLWRRTLPAALRSSRQTAPSPCPPLCSCLSAGLAPFL